MSNMQTFACPACGKTIGAEVPSGSSVTCPLCQQVVTVPGDVPMAVAIPPTSPTDPRWQGASSPAVRQGLAIASMVLGILGLATSCLPVLGLVALILGVVALVKASRRPGEYGGQGFAIAGVCLGGVSLLLCVVVLPMMIAIMLPSLSRARELAKRSVCAANLSGTGVALRMYAGQYNGQYPPDVDALVSSGVAQVSQFVCPSTTDHDAASMSYTPGQPLPPKIQEVLHSCYDYIPGQTPDSHPENVLMYEKRDCHQGEGGNVLFADHSARWLEPYSEVERLVEQTKARLAGGGMTSESPEP
jgi:competence protein ComGC